MKLSKPSMKQKEDKPHISKMKDYKYEVLLRAVKVAQQKGLDFYSLPEEEQEKLISEAYQDNTERAIEAAMLRMEDR